MQKKREFTIDEFRFQIASTIVAVIFLVVMLWSAGAFGQTARKNFQTMASTPDISVSATATAEIIRTGRPLAWVYIKNDCADTIYFDLRGARDGNSNDFPLRLAQDQTFTFEGPFHSLAVSHGSVSTAACTVTVIPAR